MNTATLPERPASLPAARPQPATAPVTLVLPARATWADRLAMRVALALLLWSTRPRVARTDRRQPAAAETARREREWERRALLLPLS